MLWYCSFSDISDMPVKNTTSMMNLSISRFTSLIFRCTHKNSKIFLVLVGYVAWLTYILFGKQLTYILERLIIGTTLKTKSSF